MGEDGKVFWEKASAEENGHPWWRGHVARLGEARRTFDLFHAGAQRRHHHPGDPPGNPEVQNYVLFSYTHEPHYIHIFNEDPPLTEEQMLRVAETIARMS